MGFPRILLVGAIAAGVGVCASSSALAQGEQFFAVLLGGNEVGGGDPDGYGAASVIFTPNGICYSILVHGIDTPQAAHIHEANAGANAPPAITLKFPSRGNAGSVSACRRVGDAIKNRMRARPNGFYINVHTTVFPDGAIRGQLF